MKLSRNLNEEQERHVRENMTEEELVIFDILTRPAPELSADERAEVKKVARELLNRLKQLLVLNWRQKAAVPRTAQARHRRCPRYRPASHLLTVHFTSKSVPPFSSTFTRAIPNATRVCMQCRVEQMKRLKTTAYAELDVPLPAILDRAF